MAKVTTIDSRRAREFQIAFQAYVRAESDLRPRTVREMAVLDPEVFIAQMGEVPQDVAVIFSTEVDAGDQIAWSEVLALKGKARAEAMCLLRANGQRPFRFATPNHPAKQLLKRLLVLPEGIGLCAAVYAFLAWAVQQPSYRPHLFSGDRPSRAAPEEPDLDEVPEGTEEGLANAGLLFDPREDDADRGDLDDEPVGRGSALNDALDEREEENDDDA